MKDFAKTNAIHGLLNRVTGLPATEPGAVADLDDPGSHGRIQPEQNGDVAQVRIGVRQQALQTRQHLGSWRERAKFCDQSFRGG